MATPPAAFIARAMCALAAASLITAPVVVNADAGAPKHKVHKKTWKKKGVARKHKRKRSAGYLPKTTTVTTTTTTPAPPPPPPPPPPPAPTAAAAVTGYSPNLGIILGGLLIGGGAGAVIGSSEGNDSPGG